MYSTVIVQLNVRELKHCEVAQYTYVHYIGWSIASIIIQPRSAIYLPIIYRSEAKCKVALGGIYILAIDVLPTVLYNIILHSVHQQTIYMHYIIIS